MPVPGFLAGIHAAHGKLGRLPWAKLFRPAIGYARNGVAVSPKIIESAKRKGALHPQGKALWIRDGEFLKPGQKLVQASLGETLHAVATDGPSAFYEGVFSRNYVARAKSDNGKLTLDDMSRWRELVRTKSDQPEGNYRDHQVLGGGLIVYALHLNEALDLRATGPAGKSPDSVWKQIRIMEEVFLSTKSSTPAKDARSLSTPTMPGNVRSLSSTARAGKCHLMPFSIPASSLFATTAGTLLGARIPSTRRRLSGPVS
jgi:gamma-glutamyltranspeptidase